MYHNVQKYSLLTLILLALLLGTIQSGCNKKPNPKKPEGNSVNGVVSCKSQDDCSKLGEVCRDGACKVVACQSSNDPACVLGEKCNVGEQRCVAPCFDSSECNGKVCRDEICVEPVACQSSINCERGETCDPSTRKCRLGATCSAERRCQGNDEVCFNGHCSAAGRECGVQDECGSTEVCNKTSRRCEPGRYCNGAGDCAKGELCDTHVCKPIGGTNNNEDRCVAGAKQPLTCEAETERCERNVCVPNCETSQLCGGKCCGIGTVCLEDRCVADPCANQSDAAERQACVVNNNPVCCNTGSACLNHQCAPLGEECNEIDSFCPIISYCDFSEKIKNNSNGKGRCVEYKYSEGNLCLYKDGKETFEVKKKLYWHGQVGSQGKHNQVMTIPLVGDVSGPGYTRDGVPDLVVNSYSLYIRDEAFEPGVLRVMSGRPKNGGGPEDIDYWWDSQMIEEKASKRTDIPDSERGKYENFWTFGLTTGAIGDINGDGHPDIVIEEQISWPSLHDWQYNLYNQWKTYSAPTRLRAVDGRDGRTIWKSVKGVSHNRGEWPAIALANLDHTGAAEVLFNGWVLDGENGNVLCRLKRADGSFVTNMTPIAADLDEKGNMEIILGRETFSFERTPGASTATCSPRPINPGDSNPQYFSSVFRRTNFSAVADLDPTRKGPEIATVVTTQVTADDDEKKLIVSDQNGKELWSTKLKDPWNESGPPTIADFDGDGALEVAFAGKAEYTLSKVFTASGVNPFLWTKGIHEGTSGITGSSVFDFDGDGKAEVVYADEQHFFVFNGKGNGDGSTKVRLEEPKNSLTAIEYPLVVDADADGHADIVVVSNGDSIAPEHYMYGESASWGSKWNSKYGVTVYAESENKWVPTRTVWNQHTYHYTNINDDLSIPLNEVPHWQSAWSNNFRQNVQKGNPRLAPDLTVKLQNLYGSDCSNAAPRTIKYALTNQGDRTIPAGQAKVSILVAPAGTSNFEEVHTEVNTELLAAGASIDLSYPWSNLPAKYQGDQSLKIRIEANRDGSLIECDTTNNYKEIDNVGSAAPNLKVTLPQGNAVCNYIAGKVVVKFDLSNDGAVAIPAGQAKVVVRVDSNGQITEVPFTNQSELSPNGLESFTYTYEIKEANIGKTLHIKVVADPENELPECSKGDNNVSATPPDGLLCYKQQLG